MKTSWEIARPILLAVTYWGVAMLVYDKFSTNFEIAVFSLVILVSNQISGLALRWVAASLGHRDHLNSALLHFVGPLTTGSNLEFEQEAGRLALETAKAATYAQRTKLALIPVELLAIWKIVQVALS